MKSYLWALAAGIAALGRPAAGTVRLATSTSLAGSHRLQGIASRNYSSGCNRTAAGPCTRSYHTGSSAGSSHIGLFFG